MDNIDELHVGRGANLINANLSATTCDRAVCNGSSLPICLPADPNLAWVGAFIGGRLVALARLEIKGESAVADLLLPKPFIGFGNLQVRAGANPAELYRQN
ncbi:MAG: hypothetical protein NTX58_06495 [Actinobacteria bacterium]|nr:hypothetical protein [Actinomycetota bacterium]